MIHRIGLIIGMVTLLVIPTRAMAASEAPPETTASFLQHAAAGQQSEIDLGQLAIQKASNDQVKDFGARMVADHQKAQQEVQQLAAKGGLKLSGPPDSSHTQIKQQLAKLSGKEFDRAYITTMLREHAKEMKNLEQHALVEKNPDIKQWASGSVPVVQEHLTQATAIASSLGISAESPTK